MLRMMTRRKPRRAGYHHGRLRETTIDEAVSLVDEGGPEALGLRELGRRLGVSHTAIHHHFPTVEDLAKELVAMWFRDLDRAMAAAVDPIPRTRTIDRFCALGVGYVRYAIANPHRYRMQFRGATGLVREADASFLRVLETVVACGPTAGRPIDPMVTTMLAWSAMHGLAMLWIDGALRDRLDRDGIDTLAQKVAALISQLLC